MLGELIARLIRAIVDWIDRCLPRYEPGAWNDNDGAQLNNNCYNYGCDIQTGTYAQPPCQPLLPAHLPAYEKGPMILTSNQSFGAWGEVFGDRIIATAILDRVLHHAITINIRGNSYRLKEKLKAGLLRAEETTA